MFRYIHISEEYYELEGVLAFLIVSEPLQQKLSQLYHRYVPNLILQE
jgi:hypothetical protein